VEIGLGTGVEVSLAVGIGRGVSDAGAGTVGATEADSPVMPHALKTSELMTMLTNQ
jgi:hypothetical protein